MILSSKLNKDPSPFTQHPRSAPSDLPVQPEIENRTRADSDHSRTQELSSQRREDRTKQPQERSIRRQDEKKTYPNLVNDGEYGENMGVLTSWGIPSHHGCLNMLSHGLMT